MKETYGQYIRTGESGVMIAMIKAKRGKDFYRTLSEFELTKEESNTFYKWKVFFVRMKRQFLLGRLKDKIDFVQYLLNTVYKEHRYLCKSRFYFDPICQLRVEADEARVQLYTNHAEDSVFIFAGMPAYSTGGGQRSAQLARSFAHAGKQVYYYYAQAFQDIPLQAEEKLIYQHRAIFSVTVDEVMKLAGENSVFIFEAPMQYFLPYLQAAHENKIRTIYEHIDNWKTALGRSFYQDELQQDFLDLADMITITSRNLIELLKSRTDKDVHYLPNAVDTTVFDSRKSYERPGDLVTGKDKTILYFGTLWGEWVDWALIMKTAELCPDCSFNMIGEPDLEKEQKIMKEHENIHFLGAKRQPKLPAYLKYSDIAIIPFHTDHIGVYVSPIKIFEYLAMQTKVLTTSLPDIFHYPNTLVGDTPEEWEKVIHTSGDNGDEADACRTFIQENCWQARCRSLLDFFETYGKQEEG